MKTVIEYIRAVFISLEFAIIILGVLLHIFYENRIVDVSHQVFQGENDFIKYLGLVPAAILCFLLSKGRSLLFPEQDKKVVIQNWEEYWRFKVLFNVSFLYASIFASGGIMAWGGVLINSSAIRLLVLSGSIIGSIIVVISVFVAEIAINEFFARANDRVNLRSE